MNPSSAMPWKPRYAQPCAKAVRYAPALSSSVQVGKTKVFLRAGQLADLDAMRAEKLNSAARVIQRGVRTCLLRRRFLLLRAGAVKAQSLWRGTIEPLILCRDSISPMPSCTKATTSGSADHLGGVEGARGQRLQDKIQMAHSAAHLRSPPLLPSAGKKARRLAEEMRRQQAATRIQKWVRRDIARRRYVAQRKSATTIQAAARGMAARKRYAEMRRQKAAVKLQVLRTILLLSTSTRLAGGGLSLSPCCS